MTARSPYGRGTPATGIAASAKTCDWSVVGLLRARDRSPPRRDAPRRLGSREPGARPASRAGAAPSSKRTRAQSPAEHCRYHRLQSGPARLGASRQIRRCASPPSRKIGKRRSSDLSETALLSHILPITRSHFARPTSRPAMWRRDLWTHSTPRAIASMKLPAWSIRVPTRAPVSWLQRFSRASRPVLGRPVAVVGIPGRDSHVLRTILRRDIGVL
jgi:hypothetical protein